MTYLYYSSAITCVNINDDEYNGTITYDSTVGEDNHAYRSNATYGCDTGYYHDEDVTRTCVGSAQPGTWSTINSDGHSCQRKSAG